MTAHCYLGAGGDVYCTSCGRGRVDGLHRDYEASGIDDAAMFAMRLTERMAVPCADCGRNIVVLSDAA